VKCPFCGYEESKVTDSRDTEELNAIRRRRECLKCENRFTTFETIDLVIQVKKRDGTYEDFKEEKLIKGLDAACKHSTISHDQVREIVAEIKTQVMMKQIREISTQEVGEMVMEKLSIIDPVAYIRFACVYKKLKKIEEVVRAIQTVLAKDSTEKTL
jgi:transcriptional repressor NrdR